MARVILCIVVIGLLSCRNAGRELLSSADRELKAGNFAAALLNVNQFLEQNPTSEDSASAKEIRKAAGTGQRAQATEAIKAKMAARQIPEARKLAAEIPQAFVYLPDNDLYYARLDSEIKRVEFEILAIALERALDESRMDSLDQLLSELDKRFSLDPNFLPQMNSLDSLTMHAIGHHPHPPQPPLHPQLAK